jgi:putative hemolysin
MEIIIIALLIILNGIFSMSEISLISSRKFRLASAAKKGNSNAKKALELAEDPNTFLSTVQIGITLIGILTGIYSGEALTSNLTAFLKQFEVINPYANSVAVLLIVVVITYFSIVFGELLPKRIGLQFPEKIAIAVARPMTIISGIAKPLIWLLAKTNDLFFGIFGIKEKKDEIASEEEIKQIIKRSTEGGEIQEIEQDIVRRVFSLGDRKVAEIMTHRNEMDWIDIKDSLAEIKAKLAENTHSLYPVCENTYDKLVGFVSLKQIFKADNSSDSFNLSTMLHKPIFVPESMAAYRTLEYFKSHQLHIAAVVDEYGAIQGIITINDVIDELIGDTAEPDSDESQIIQRSENSWLVDGRFPYFEFLEYFNIIEKTKAEGFTTVGGLFISETNHIPKTGEKILWNEFELEVVDMDDQRIDKLMITRIND